MDMVTYDLIGSAYSELEEKEEWLDNVESVADIAIISPEAYVGDLSTGQMTKVDDSGSGVCRIMLEGKYLFDVIDFESDLNKYKVIILPDVIRADIDFAKRLREFCDCGGKVLCNR